MEKTETVTLTLPARTVRAIRAKVASGSFSDPEAVVEESIARMDDLRDELDKWLATEGERRLDAMIADPSQSLSHEEFWAEVASESGAEEKASHSREAA